MPVTTAVAVGLRNQLAFGGGLLSETKAYISRISESLPASTKLLLNKTINDLKSNDIWGDLDVLQLYASNSPQASLLNVKGDFYNASSGLTIFAPKNGYKGTGTNYINTGYNPSLSSIVSKDDAYYGVIIKDIGTSGVRSVFGVISGTAPVLNVGFLNYNGANNVAQVNSGAFSTADNIAVTPKLGVNSIARNLSASSIVYYNKESERTNVKVSVGVPNGNIYVLATNNNGPAAQFQAATVSAFFGGRFLNKTKHDKLVDILNYYYDNLTSTITGNILVVGDSTIASYLGQTSVGWCLRGYTSINIIAAPGDTIAQQRARYNALTTEVKTSFNYVFVQIGLNDLDPAESAATALARYQLLVNDINTGSPQAKVVLGTMTPCKQRLVDVYGAVNGMTSYQKWLDMNDSIKGNGINAITDVDAVAYEHTNLLNDGSGNLKSEFEIVGTVDHIHENNAGRLIVAESWMAQK